MNFKSGFIVKIYTYSPSLLLLDTGISICYVVISIKSF